MSDGLPTAGECAARPPGSRVRHAWGVLVLLLITGWALGSGCRPREGRTAAPPQAAAPPATPTDTIAPPPPTDDIATDEVRVSALDRPLREDGSAPRGSAGPLSAQQALETVARSRTVQDWDAAVAKRRAAGERCETMVSLVETADDRFVVRVHVQAEGKSDQAGTLGWFRVSRATGEITPTRR